MSFIVFLDTSFKADFGASDGGPFQTFNITGVFMSVSSLVGRTSLVSLVVDVIFKSLGAAG